MYYPILKLRSSEINAIKEVSNKNFIPIIEAELSPKDKIIESLETLKLDYFFDCKNCPSLLDATNKIKFFPVLGIDRGYDYNVPCIELARKHQKAIIRIQRKDFYKTNEVDSLIKSIKIPRENIKILLDLETIPNTDLHKIQQDVANALSSYQNVILAGNSIPQSTSKISRNGYEIIQRREWQLFQQFKEVGMNIEFADYSVRHSQSIGSDTLNFAVPVDVKLFYTVDNNFIAFRGEQFNKKGSNGSHSIIPICQKIVNIEGFNKDYSYGDKKIYEISMQQVGNSDVKTGNSSEWIKIGHTHHITLLSDLLASN